MSNGLAVYALTPQGAALGAMLAVSLDADLYCARALADGQGAASIPPDHLFDSLRDCVDRTWAAYDGHIFVAATGIVVRVCAPHLARKDRDPAVVVLDQQGRHAISLVSGHLGGANELARRVAACTGGTPVITTATDVEGLPAIDELARERGLAIADKERIKDVSAALLRGEPVGLYDPADGLGLGGAPEAQYFQILDQDPATGMPDGLAAAVRVSASTCPLPIPGLLCLHPRDLVAGVGCRRGTTRATILTALRDACATVDRSAHAIAVLASADIKREEAGLLDAARVLHAQTVFFTSNELDVPEVPTPSATVRGWVGTASVCEAAALLASGAGVLLSKKRVQDGVTVALALRTIEE